VSQVIMQVAAKALIVNSSGKVLILREPLDNNVGSQNGLYGLPGGRMETDESFETALHREVMEETGLTVSILYPLFVGEWSPVIKGQKCHIVAIFNVCQAKTTAVKLSEEHDKFEWIDPREANKFQFMPPEDLVIKRYHEWQNNHP
jgi:8-oxo-dGTP diphosphatase